MKPLEIKGARTRLGYTTSYMAYLLGIADDSYRKKERGIVKFSDEEKVVVAKALELSAQQVNDYFFDGKLPTG
jgi:DNA-binding XRE family transcriptional regulator